MKMKLFFLTLLPVLALLAIPVRAQDGLAAKARAILAENCFDCHGPDKAQRKAKLRLDVREGAVRDLGGYRSVMPGKPDQSELIARLVTKDEDELMPPMKTGKSLSQEEIGVLKQWIEEGAEYPAHWSFRPIRPPALPRLQKQEGVLSPIDHFVFAKLESMGLVPSPEADAESSQGASIMTCWACHPTQPASKLSQRTGIPALTPSWSTSSCNRLTSENDGGDTGWTWPVMRTRTVTRRTGLGPMHGFIVIG